MINNITGIILAGGKSSRMGTNKAFLKIGGRTIIEEIFSKFKSIFSRVIIVTNKIERFNVSGAQIISDIIPSKGSLGGIYTGLLKSDSFYNFIVACDMPFLNQNLIRFMSTKVDGYDVVMPKRSGRLQPLCAFYSKNCIKPIENQLQKNNLKIGDFFQHIKVRIITEEEISRFDPQGLSFININTNGDYQKLEHRQVYPAPF